MTLVKHSAQTCILLLLTLFITACGCCTLPSLSEPKANAKPVDKKKPPAAAIASAHPLATEAGLKVLRAGGNAFDAAIAVASTLAVVEPQSSGMGGGGFWLLHSAQTGKDIFLDAREMAPLAATRDMYLNTKGEVDRDLAINGPLAAGIPGQAAAFAHLSEHYGKLSLEQVLSPAIKAAEEGFEINPILQGFIQLRKKTLERYPSSRATFLPKGTVPAVDFVLKQPDLAKTLTAIANKGFDGFYKGEVAQKLVTGAQEAGGIWTLKDLASYKIVEREPIRFSYQDYEIISAPPPSSGGIALATILGILENYDLEMLSPADKKHLVIEAMRRAYKDRAEFLGDTDFVHVPVNILTSTEHSALLAQSIDMQKATPSKSLEGKKQVQQGTDTTHFSIIDHEGNRVSATLSVNLPLGSGFIAPETGILFNNEMDDFSAKPLAPNAYGLIGSAANAIAPGKRPLSSMTPTFVESKKQVAILGTPGGSRIITMVLLGIMEHLEGKASQEWVDRPRYHHQYLPDTIQYEPGAFTFREMKQLKQKGHTFKMVSERVTGIGHHYGNMHAVLWDIKEKQVEAASDPRGIGSAKVIHLEEDRKK